MIICLQRKTNRCGEAFGDIFGLKDRRYFYYLTKLSICILRAKFTHLYADVKFSEARVSIRCELNLSILIAYSSSTSIQIGIVTYIYRFNTIPIYVVLKVWKQGWVICTIIYDLTINLYRGTSDVRIAVFPYFSRCTVASLITITNYHYLPIYVFIKICRNENSLFIQERELLDTPSIFV